jgi:hypothetical protein
MPSRLGTILENGPRDAASRNRLKNLIQGLQHKLTGVYGSNWKNPVYHKNISGYNTMKNSFENLVKEMKQTLPKAKPVVKNAAYNAAIRASNKAHREAIEESLKRIARRSPERAASLNAELLKRVEQVEKSLASLSPKPRRQLKTKPPHVRYTGIYIPPPPSLNKLQKEAIERNELRRLLNREAAKALKKK